MIIKEVIIEYTTPKEYPSNPEMYPPVTHTRLANVSMELPRPTDGKESWMKIWMTPGYCNPEGTFHTAIGFEGEYFEIDEAEMTPWSQILANPEAIMLEFTRVISEELINLGYIDGVAQVYEIEYNP